MVWLTFQEAHRIRISCSLGQVVPSGQPSPGCHWIPYEHRTMRSQALAQPLCPILTASGSSTRAELGEEGFLRMRNTKCLRRSRSQGRESFSCQATKLPLNTYHIPGSVPGM